MDPFLISSYETAAFISKSSRTTKTGSCAPGPSRWQLVQIDAKLALTSSHKISLLTSAKELMIIEDDEKTNEEEDSDNDEDEDEDEP